MEHADKFNSNIKTYWFVWLIIVFLLLTLRFSVFRNPSDSVIFSLFTFYAIPTWIAVIIINGYSGHCLMSYLKRNHRAKWDEITYVPLFGSGGRNSFRSLAFIYSEDDLDDRMVHILKKNYRSFVKLALTIFFSFPILFLIIALLPY
jgi:hypothetical protein